MGVPHACVEVAVDAAGAGGAHTYTYGVPDALADLAPGEAVLVDYGRRQALGIVLGPAAAPPGMAVKPVRARIRTDGPLLPGPQLLLARWIAGHYLAPAALVIRTFLPPGTLERVELVARAAGGADTPEPRGEAGSDPDPARDRANAADPVLERIVASGPRGIAVRQLPPEGGRATLLRHVRALEAQGRIALDWVIRAASAAPRLERRIALTEEGRAAAGALAAEKGVPGRPLGPRQRALLAELAESLGSGAPTQSVAAAPLAARHGASALQGLLRRGFVAVDTVERPRLPLALRPPGPRGTRPAGAPLSEAQARAVGAVERAVRARTPSAFLLDGVAGAGKTAIYAAAISASLAAGRGALILVPEIALATPLVDRVRAELGIEVALVHGSLGEGERADEWRRIRAGEAQVVVGTRSAVLAPLADPGVIIVDEEHDAGYKSDRTPRYQARDVALALGELAMAPVVLGSATPDVATVGRAREGAYVRFELPERAAGRRPSVEIVDLRAELAAGNRGLLSGFLVRALRELRTAEGDRAILVINRRGAASVVLCRDCGYVQVCPECRRPLVYHATEIVLRCHHCGASAPIARRCPACDSPRIRYLGGGTERVEREARDRFPTLRVARLDRDVAERRGAVERILDAFRDGEIDVLVGTSLVAKGIDVPEVTLVGVVSADVALNLPDARATERTYQLLVQAIGRAGRGERPGRAIIQTYQPGHPAVVAAASGEADAFYDAELETRRAFGAPPFGELVKLTVALADREAAQAEARRFATELRARAALGGGETPAVEVLGPVPAYVPRRAGRWRFHVVLRGSDPVALLGRDPGPPWSVDVDPESLL